MKKALLVTTVSGFVPQFEMNSVALLKQRGYEIHYASNFNYVFYGNDNSRLNNTGIIRHQIDFARSPYSKQTLTAYKQLCRLLNEFDFDVVHCHTPIGGLLARMAAKKYKVKTVIYTAHGFHFFKGAPAVNWLVYYTAERFAARYTDVLITINKEDYNNACKFKLKKNGKVYYLPGAGVDTNLYNDTVFDCSEKRKELGIGENDFVILSVGELNKNKNHSTVIRALSKIDTCQIRYLICGKGEEQEHLEELIKELNLNECVKLLGFRDDINEICNLSDLFVFPSYREGLPVSLMEAMACGLPVLASRIRGNTDLVDDDVNGYLISPSSSEEWAKRILYMKENTEKRKAFGIKNKEDMKSYSKQEVKKQLDSIYSEWI